MRKNVVVFAAATLTFCVSANAQGVAPVERVRRVDVRSAGPAQCSLNAGSSNLPSGGSTTLTWNTTGASRVTLEGGNVAQGGSLTVRPITDATYTLVAHGGPGTDPAVCTAQIRVAQPACVNGAICAVSCGTGMIPDVRTGDLLILAPERQVHVLIVAEGYTAADLPRFHTNSRNDVDDWMDGFEALSPFKEFREAFCVWKLPAVSSQRIVPGGLVETTAFRVPVSSGGNVDLSDPVAKRVVEEKIWAEVERLPYPPAHFYPTTAERTRGMAKNAVVVALLFDPAWGRAGYGGRTALLDHPTSTSRTVAAAFALHRTHEFAHAFARLRDEYVELDGDPACVPKSGAWSSGNVSNVVCPSRCAEIPWSHLVEGGAHNPGIAGLVGAFGHPDEGYHPELKCLMNGDRTDNATVFGGETELRDPARMCNFCRELTTFRLFERIGRLEDTSTSYATWQSAYRRPFFEAYGFDAPSIVPMETPPGRPVFRPCTVP